MLKWQQSGFLLDVVCKNVMLDIIFISVLQRFYCFWNCCILKFWLFLIDYVNKFQAYVMKKMIYYSKCKTIDLYIMYNIWWVLILAMDHWQNGEHWKNTREFILLFSFCNRSMVINGEVESIKKTWEWTHSLSIKNKGFKMWRQWVYATNQLTSVYTVYMYISTGPILHRR